MFIRDYPNLSAIFLEKNPRNLLKSLKISFFLSKSQKKRFSVRFKISNERKEKYRPYPKAFAYPQNDICGNKKNEDIQSERDTFQNQIRTLLCARVFKREENKIVSVRPADRYQIR